MADHRVSMPLSQVAIWIGLAVLGGAFAHELLIDTRPASAESVAILENISDAGTRVDFLLIYRQYLEQSESATDRRNEFERSVREDTDRRVQSMITYRNELAQFAREFPPEERAGYVGLLRYSWHWLTQFVRGDARFAKFRDSLTDLQANKPADFLYRCPAGTDRAFEFGLRFCRQMVTQNLFSLLVLRSVGYGNVRNVNHRSRLMDRFRRVPFDDQERVVEEMLRNGEWPRRGSGVAWASPDSRGKEARMPSGRAIVFAGWILMFPTVSVKPDSGGVLTVDWGKPITAWNHWSAHDTAKDCEEAKYRWEQVFWASPPEKDKPGDTPAAVQANRAQAAMCVPSEFLYPSYISPPSSPTPCPTTTKGPAPRGK